MSEQTISDQAKEFIKSHKKELISNFADLSQHPPQQTPFSIFMAGSPGAGKTEFSKAFIANLEEKLESHQIVRLDTDEVREFIPLYDGHNSSAIQPAAAIGVEKIFDYVQEHKQNVVVDSTLANYDIAHKDIQRSINRGRKVAIFYVYQDPKLAWDFTKKREKLEGRYVPEEVFIHSFLMSKQNSQKLKEEFGSKIELHMVIKNLDNTVQKLLFNISDIDSFLNRQYTIGQLRELIK